MVFVPVTWQDALSLRCGADLGRRPACTATLGLMSAFEDQTTLEEAEFVALNHAGALALFISAGGRRLLLAAEVDLAQITDEGSTLGEVTVSGLAWSQVGALFADEPEASAAVTKAVASVQDHGGRALAEALGLAEVAELMENHDLLWFAPHELDQLGEATV
jgi:hypothetical protein